jgi:ArsR family transcriptional regulator
MDNIKLSKSEEDINKTAAILKVMASPSRFKILCVLQNEALSVSDICRQAGLLQPNASQHLDTLKNKNIVESHRNGNKVLYRVRNTSVLRLIDNMQTVFCPDSIN